MTLMRTCGFALFLAAVGAYAQTATGVIGGTIKDPTGAVIPGVTVTLTDQATNQMRKQTSTAAGAYEFRALSRGAYTLGAEAEGFKKEVITGINLQVAQAASIDVSLELGDVAETVTVEGTAVLLESADANLSQVIDQNRIRELPLNGRNFMQLVGLASGVVAAGRASATQRQANYGPAFTVGGQRDNTSVVLVDGIEISGMELNNYPYAVPSLESVAEFRVQTSSYSAEFGGNSGAIVNVVSRRGANKIHGSIFEFLRNDNLDARNFFSTDVAPLTRNQFGLILSGPVVLPGYDGHNKTFWMFSYEDTRLRTGISSTSLVPNEQERTGDFSGVTDPSFKGIVEPFSKERFPNNTIPQSLINPVGKKLIDLYPAPNNPADPERNFFGTPPKGLDQNNYSGRIDHQLTSADSFFTRWTVNEPNDIGVGSAFSPGFPGFNAVQEDRNIHIAAGDIHIFNSSIINELNVGFVRFRRNRLSEDAFKTDRVKEIGIRGIATQPATFGAPSVLPQGFGEVGFSRNNAVLQWRTQSMQVVDNVSIIYGNQTLKFGGSFQKKQLNSVQWGAPNGDFRFSGEFSTPVPVTETTRFNALSDLLLGYPNEFNVQTGPFQQRFRYLNTALYFQDDWRVTPNLTINLGIRWEFFGKPEDKYNQIATFDLGTGQQLFPGDLFPNGRVVPRSLTAEDLNNWGPRAGFAWKVLGSDRLVVRAGYGLTYSPWIGNDFRAIGFQDPFAERFNRVVRSADTSRPLPVFSVDDPLRDLSQSTFFNRRGVDPHFKDAYIQQWNFTIQHLLTESTLLEVAYRGSKSTNLQTVLNFNETDPFPLQPPDFKQIFPFPDLTTVNILQSRGAATYNALQTRLERRLKDGFTVLGSFTYSKTLTDIDSSSVGVARGAGAFAPQTIKDLRANKGSAIFDRPFQLVVSTLYELPFSKDQQGALGHLVGGWQVGAIGSFISGAFLTPSQFGAQFTGSRPNFVGDPKDVKDRSPDHYINVAALANPEPGQLGNAGKGTIQGSGTNNWNLVVQKNTKIAEGQRVQFRVEFFNAFNHTRFDDPQLFPATNPNAGKILSASDDGFNQTERVIQFGLKYQF